MKWRSLGSGVLFSVLSNSALAQSAPVARTGADSSSSSSGGGAEGRSFAASPRGISPWVAPWESDWRGPVRRVPAGFSLDLTLGRRTGAQADVSSGVDAAARDRARTEFFALATLNVPLQHFFFVPEKKSALPQERLPEKESGAPDTEREPLASPPSSARGKEPSSQHDFLYLAREVMKRVSLARETKARLSSLASRSRSAGWVPELRLRGVYGFDRTVSSEESQGIYPGETTTRGARDSLVEARLTFRLDRLVLGDGEPAIERQRAQLEASESKKREKVLSLLLAWKEAETRLRRGSLLEDELLTAELKSEGALAELHLATGGWFRGHETVRALGLSLFRPEGEEEDARGPEVIEASSAPIDPERVDSDERVEEGTSNHDERH